jgi:SAM-dependent MidA family methyltransferase
METALYHPQLGYYAKSTAQVGRGGDFFTSVSVGPLFGGLLARRFLGWWQASGKPVRWRLVESGAHDGSLARDVLETLARLEPDAFSSLELVIPEPLPLLRKTQQETLRPWREKVRFLDAPEDAVDAVPGIVYGNEVLDALPFHVVEWHGGGWRELRVGCGGDGTFRWEHADPDAELRAALEALPAAHFPEGYRTEVRTAVAAFLQPLVRLVSPGLFVWIDYYHPDRTRGTLRTFNRHRAAEDPLVEPGGWDITAHVDFSAAAEISASLGSPPIAFKNQGAWLTEVARPWLEQIEGAPDMKLIRQFQTLTHPGHLGARFHVLECAAGDSTAVLAETDARRLALRPCS